MKNNLREDQNSCSKNFFRTRYKWNILGTSFPRRRYRRDSQIEFYPVNVPIIRRRDATPQDGLRKTPRYACARILGTWFQRSRHFPLILSIVPPVRNSGFWKRSRVLFPRRRPRLRAHNRANFWAREHREIQWTGAQKSEGNAPNTFDNLPLLWRGKYISKVHGIEAIPYGIVVKKKDRKWMDRGRYSLVNFQFLFVNRSVVLRDRTI